MCILVCNSGSSSLKCSLFESEGERLLVGEHATEIRAQVCESLGLELDCTANEMCQPDADVALPASTSRILVIITREDVTIVRETRRLLARS